MCSWWTFEALLDTCAIIDAMGQLFTVRQATIDDAQTLAAFASRTFHEAFADFVPTDSMNQYLATSFNAVQVTTDLSDTDSVFLLAVTSEGQLAGYARLFFGKSLPEVQGANPVKLWRLYTACEWQGKGVGKALLTEALQVARKQDGQTLWLTVNQGNKNAIAFYQKHGFRETGRAIFKLGKEIHQDFIMERDIDI